MFVCVCVGGGGGLRLWLCFRCHKMPLPALLGMHNIEAQMMNREAKY